MNNKEIGAAGEDAVCQALSKQGWRIVERNFRIRTAEVDIIAYEEDSLCFIEVKTRLGTGFGLPCEAVTPAKQKKIIRAAEYYLAYHEIDAPVRFDVMEVYATVRGGIFSVSRYNLIRGAFDAGERR